MNTSERRYDVFARNYIIDLNGTRAAIAAGYSERTAAVQASTLLKYPKVIRLIDKYQSQRANRLELKADRVLEELATIGYANMWDYIRVNPGSGTASLNFSALDADKARAIQELTVDEYTEGKGEEAREVKRIKFKLADKRSALELLGKHLKLFTDKTEISGDIPFTLVTNVQLPHENV